jgi:hypothetical protein
MVSGIHSEVVVGDPCGCDVAPLSEGTQVHSVSRSIQRLEDETMTVDFTVADGLADAETPADVESVFSVDGDEVYRYDEGSAGGCVCTTIENCGCPVRSLEFVDGAAVAVFIAPTIAVLREVVTRLRERFGGVSIRRLSQTPAEAADADLVLVDRADLTDRQRETLRTAHEMGYFARPREANGTEVAGELGISVATFTEHLAVAQSKLLDAVLDA